MCNDIYKDVTKLYRQLVDSLRLYLHIYFFLEISEDKVHKKYHMMKLFLGSKTSFRNFVCNLGFPM